MPATSTSRKKTLFDHYRKSLTAAGLRTECDESLICPLCWQESPFEELSLEHIVPSSVGGTRCTLTCTRCNNEHGSALDSHLSQFQTTRDGFKGHGTLPAKLKVLGEEVVANVEWGDGFKNINIVGRASNPAKVTAMHDDTKAGKVDELHLMVSFGYNKNRFQTSLLRCAYLALFNRFGYEYAKHDVTQVIRHRICDTSLEHPRLGSLIGKFRDGTLPFRNSYTIVERNVNGVQCYLVAIQLHKQTTTRHFVFLPALVARCEEFFGMMEWYSKENGDKKLSIPHKFFLT